MQENAKRKNVDKEDKNKQKRKRSETAKTDVR
jgi:hypothetical protein